MRAVIDEPAVAVSRSRWSRTGWAVAVVTVLAAAATVTVLAAPGPQGSPPGTTAAEAAVPADTADPTGTAGSSVPAVPDSPFQAAIAVLDAQAQGLNDGDEARWLAPVDPAQPKLVSRYRMMFRSLRALELGSFLYRPHLLSDPASPVLRVDGDVAYCFNRVCSRYAADSGLPPDARQVLTLKKTGGRWLITAMSQPDQVDHLAPAPWMNDDLVFRRGARVIVAGPRSQAKKLDAVLAIAEESARLNDRFAGYVQNPQARYRIYLADDRAWRTWYDGAGSPGTIGYAIQLNASGTDVVLRMGVLAKDPPLLAVTIRHEMGHVVTLSGINTQGADELWLTEGIAEYIGWSPQPATKSLRMPSVRSWLRGHRLTTIAQPAPPDDASLARFDAFYGLAHLATYCMQQRYGEKALFDFIRFELQDGLGFDNASKQAYGRPFATVDKECVSWIQGQEG
jgi:hypothetical protein